MRTFIFGANGMIGSYLMKYLDNCVPITRKRVDAVTIRQDLFDYQLKRLDMREGDVVINAMGITNKRTVDGWEFMVVNSLFPRLLADYCEKLGVNMIHISTDCVYSGHDGNYSEDDEHDDQNIYGISKSRGEPINCTVIRASIIGENKNNSLDLLEWVRKTSNGTLHGLTDKLWNGITCLRFAKICSDIINENLFWKGVVHVYSPEVISKADLLEMINEIYELNNQIIRVESERYCNRSLTSSRNIFFNIPSIKAEIEEQKNFDL